jgi:hypothetical protein
MRESSRITDLQCAVRRLRAQDRDGVTPGTRKLLARWATGLLTTSVTGQLCSMPHHSLRARAERYAREWLLSPPPFLAHADRSDRELAAHFSIRLAHIAARCAEFAANRASSVARSVLPAARRVLARAERDRRGGAGVESPAHARGRAGARDPRG